MVSRKETPDVLGELLGSGATVSRPVPTAEPDLATIGEVHAALVMDPEPGPQDAPAVEPEPQPAVAPEPRPVPKRKAPTRPANRQRQPKKVRWEYVEVVFCDHGGFRPRFINGQEVRNWKRTPPIHDYLSHLGRQGWELAGVGGRHRGRMPAYLKRPKL